MNNNHIGSSSGSQWGWVSSYVTESPPSSRESSPSRPSTSGATHELSSYQSTRSSRQGDSASRLSELSMGSRSAHYQERYSSYDARSTYRQFEQTSHDMSTVNPSFHLDSEAASNFMNMSQLRDSLGSIVAQRNMDSVGGSMEMGSGVLGRPGYDRDDLIDHLSSFSNRYETLTQPVRDNRETRESEMHRSIRSNGSKGFSFGIFRGR